MITIPVQMKPDLILQMIPKINHVATGKAVRAYRESLGVTQLCVAQNMGKNYQTQVSFLEAGKRNWTAARLATVVAAIERCASISSQSLAGENQNQNQNQEQELK